MRKLVLALAFVAALIAVPAKAQDNIYLAGVAYNPGASPAVAGSAAYAHAIPSTPGTYAFTAFDALPSTLKPVTVTTNVGVGVAQKMFSIASHDVFCTTSTGVAWTGSNAGWQYGGGCAVPHTLKTFSDGSKLVVVPGARFLKASVGGAGYTPIIDLRFGLTK